MERTEQRSAHTNVIQSWDDNHNRFLTLYVAGRAAGRPGTQADYWSLPLDQAVELGCALIREAGRAEGLERGSEAA